MTDVSAGFRPPCWCPCTWAPAWRLHTNLYKFGENVSSHIFYEKNCRDLNLGESLCICTFFLFPDSGLTLLNGFDFLFRSILSGVTLKTSNRFISILHGIMGHGGSPYKYSLPEKVKARYTTKCYSKLTLRLSVIPFLFNFKTFLTNFDF